MSRETQRRTSSPVIENTDPVLAKLADEAVFDVSWEDLRHSLYLGLVGALPLFLEKGPPVQYSGLIQIEAAPSPTSGAGRDPDVSPNAGTGGGAQPISWGEKQEGGSGNIGPDAEGVIRMGPAREDNPELRPSTQGGLVIPPFPPLDTERRRRPSRLNGTPSKNPFEDDWDEETIIGGRKLPGWLDEEDGKREIEKVAKKLDALTVPPFTLQRLAELLIAPTRLHSTLGKFLRAVEKMLSVTTPFARPSYTYVPPPPLPLDDDDGSPAIMNLRTDPTSTVPPGSMTPLFSPIPFLSSHDMDGLGEPMMEDGGGRVEEGLMSPLMLEPVFSVQQGSRRSPTPEPEEDAEMAEDTPNEDGTEPKSDSPPGAASAHAANGANATSSGDSRTDETPQGFLGFVDELDAGPVRRAATNGHGGDGDRTGEGGSEVVRHEMSDRPFAISSTTVLPDPEGREIAPLPRSSPAAAADRAHGDAAHAADDAAAASSLAPQASAAPESASGEDSVAGGTSEAGTESEGEENPQLGPAAGDATAPATATDSAGEAVSAEPSTSTSPSTGATCTADEGKMETDAA